MAVLITIFQCDCCKKLTSLKTTEDWKIFEETWLDGVYSQFCSDCGKSPENKARVVDDARMISELAKRVCEEGGILNAEFIN